MSYTILSEWMNTVALEGWRYSALMPVVRLGSLELGVSPLMQWVMMPFLAVSLALRGHRAPRSHQSR